MSEVRGNSVGGLTSSLRELAPQLQKAPSAGVIRLRRWRAVKRRGPLLLIAAVSIPAVFVSGYVVRAHRGESVPRNPMVRTLALRGTSIAPKARARLEVWHVRDGNSPLTLSVVGLPKLPPHTYYEVDLLRGKKPFASCGEFRTARSFSHRVTLTLNAPFALRKGDSWVVTRQPQGREGGVTVLRQSL
jgi:hypothetical protein